MYDTMERIKRVKLRAEELRFKQEKWLLGALSILCVVLPLSLIGAIRMVTSRECGTVLGLYGTMLLYEDAGGYVLVGVITFAAAVIITVLCIRYRERQKERFKKKGAKKK